MSDALTSPSTHAGSLRMAALSLLLHQVMKPAHRLGRAAAAGERMGASLTGLLGGAFGDEGPHRPAAAGGLGGVVAGMGGLIETLRRHGLARQVDSWVGPGPNLPVSPAELARLLDPEEVDTLARQAGADRQALLREVSTLLPAFIDRLTPQGRVPQRAEEVGGAGLGALLDGLMGTQRRGPEGPI